MSEDINNLDTHDEGLKAIFGERFHDITEPAKAVSKKETPTTTYPTKAAQKVKERAVEPQWDPTKENTWYDNLKAIVKDVSLFAFLSFVLFWWQQTGRLEVTTSWYALLFCVGMVFFSVGKNCRGGDRRGWKTTKGGRPTKGN